MNDPSVQPEEELTHTMRECVTELKHTSFIAALRLVLVVGAAIHDANDAQLARLRKRIPAATEEIRTTGEVTTLRRLLAEVMGPAWSPSGKWAEQIAALGPPGD